MAEDLPLPPRPPRRVPPARRSESLPLPPPAPGRREEDISLAPPYEAMERFRAGPNVAQGRDLMAKEGRDNLYTPNTADRRLKGGGKVKGCGIASRGKTRGKIV